MSIDIDTISVIIGKCLTLEVMEDVVQKMPAEELVQLAAQVAIAEALQELVYVLHAYSGIQ